MRRTTAGVLGAEELIGPRIARAELHDPARIVAVLEPMVTEGRRARLKEVIARRLASVAVVLDGPYDPHNGAAVVRSCEAFGVQKIHVVEQEKHAFVVARSVSRGAEKWVDLVRHKQAPSVIAWAKAQGMPLVGAHPQGELAPEELAKIPRVALVLGNERDGIRDEIAQACAMRVRVPMNGFVESLNMSVTAAILLYAATLGRSGDLDEAARLRLYARGLYLTLPKSEDILESEASRDR